MHSTGTHEVRPIRCLPVIHLIHEHKIQKNEYRAFQLSHVASKTAQTYAQSTSNPPTQQKRFHSSRFPLKLKFDKVRKLVSGFNLRRNAIIKNMSNEVLILSKNWSYFV